METGSGKVDTLTQVCLDYKFVVNAVKRQGFSCCTAHIYTTYGNICVLLMRINMLGSIGYDRDLQAAALGPNASSLT